MGKRILQLTEAELAEIQASGFLPVAVSGETFRLAINKLLANWKPWATEPTKGSLEISTTQYPATIPVKIGDETCGYLVPAPPTNETGVVLSWVDEETGFAWREDIVLLTITPIIVDTTATLTIEQGGFASIDLTSETALTAVDVVLTNASGVTFPVWWFKIKLGSDITLSVKIGGVAVGWLGSEITNIELGKTIEVSVVDGIACGGELV